MAERVPFVEEVQDMIGGTIIASTVRPATQEDVDEARAKYLKSSCPHNIVFDEPGQPYDLRFCYTCGCFLGGI